MGNINHLTFLAGWTNMLREGSKFKLFLIERGFTGQIFTGNSYVGIDLNSYETGCTNFFWGFQFHTWKSQKDMACHKVWTAKLLTWYLELNWSVEIITVFKLLWMEINIMHLPPRFKYIFIICYRTLKDALLLNWLELLFWINT